MKSSPDEASAGRSEIPIVKYSEMCTMKLQYKGSLGTGLFVPYIGVSLILDRFRGRQEQTGRGISSLILEFPFYWFPLYRSLTGLVEKPRSSRSEVRSDE